MRWSLVKVPVYTLKLRICWRFSSMDCSLWAECLLHDLTSAAWASTGSMATPRQTRGNKVLEVSLSS